MIYDCFTFFNELEILELRLNILNDIVDKFVIVEANQTHKGDKKEFIFEQNKSKFEKFLDKIIYVKLENLPDIKLTKENPDGDKWILENYQRDEILQGLKNACENDIVIISDCDEIPNPRAINKFKKINKRNIKRGVICSLQQLRFVFNYNTLIIQAPFSQSAKICFFKDLKNPNKTVDKKCTKFCAYSEYGKPTYLRFCKCKKIRNGGWHFSFIGDERKNVYKLNSRVEKLVEENNEATMKKYKEETEKSLANLEICDIFPKYFIENQAKYEEFICKYNIVSKFKAVKLFYLAKLKKVFNKVFYPERR